MSSQNTQQPNIMTKYNAMYKYELAAAAGVSSETFRRWLKSDKDFLEQSAVTPRQKILPPNVVAYLCDKYCIIIN